MLGLNLIIPLLPRHTRLFGLTMDFLTQLHLAKIQTMTQPNSPDMLLKQTKKADYAGIQLCL